MRPPPAAVMRRRIAAPGTGSRDRAGDRLVRAARADRPGHLAGDPGIHGRRRRCSRLRGDGPLRRLDPPGQGQRSRHKVADRTRTPGDAARRRPQDQPADRRGTVLEPKRPSRPTCATSSTRWASPPAPRSPAPSNAPAQQRAGDQIGPPGLLVLVPLTASRIPETEIVVYRAGHTGMVDMRAAGDSSLQ